MDTKYLAHNKLVNNGSHHRASAANPAEKKNDRFAQLWTDTGETLSLVLFLIHPCGIFLIKVLIHEIFILAKLHRPNKKKKNRWALVCQETMGRIKNGDIKPSKKKEHKSQKDLMLPHHPGKTPCSWIPGSHRTCYWKMHQGALVEELTGLDSYFLPHKITSHLLWTELIWMFCEQTHYGR